MMAASGMGLLLPYSTKADHGRKDFPICIPGMWEILAWRLWTLL